MSITLVEKMNNIHDKMRHSCKEMIRNTCQGKLTDSNNRKYERRAHPVLRFLKYM
jgi:hypothetical protein